MTHGNHDELYELLRTDSIDIVLNDQRRAFSDEYKNIVLDVQENCIEISAKSPIAELDSIEITDLKNIPLILLSSAAQQQIEREFYCNYIGFQSEIIFCETSEDAKMLLVQGRDCPLTGGCIRWFPGMPCRSS